MHYHLEIIMPPTDNIEEAVAEILAPYDENWEPPPPKEGEEFNEDERRSPHAFWDWYVIGGRWAGTKLMARYEGPALDAFRAELDTLKVTVSGVQAGKQELNPPEQVTVVDALWCKHFPDSGVTVCPLFNHSNNQYTEHMYMDICTVREIPPELKAAHVIIAGRYKTDRSLQAMDMFRDSIWNGVTWQDTDWDCKVHTILAKHAARLEHSSDEYRQFNTITDDWLAVTVDYHS
jgi:hypothetical protein